ncbi:hypothetical protein [Okeania sp. SIO3I5]|nr:hypothetical protein [Okeania sp. SIO3I5]
MVGIDAVFVPSFQFYRQVTNISCYTIAWVGIHPDAPEGESAGLLPTFR